MLFLRHLKSEGQFWPVRLLFFGYDFVDSQKTVGFWVNGKQANWVIKVYKFILWQFKCYFLRFICYFWRFKCYFLRDTWFWWKSTGRFVRLNRLSYVTHLNLTMSIDHAYLNTCISPVRYSFFIGCTCNLRVSRTMFKLYFYGWKVERVILFAMNEHLITFYAAYVRYKTFPYLCIASRHPILLLNLKQFFATGLVLYFLNCTFWI